MLEELGLDRGVPAPVQAPVDEFAGDYRQGATEVSITIDGEAVVIQVTDSDPISGEQRRLVPLRAHAVGERRLVVADGEERGTRVELPRLDLLRIGARLFVRR